ncbi:MAG TPA: histidine phosphatase family protein [Jatrophihabitans sp.]|nr:histidine phosphatase family protein [Jatrophihabitans sp.]
MTGTTVHLLRHGEVRNPDGVLYGRLPGFGLSETGLRMAEQAAAALAGHDIRHLVSSPLQRAQQTAEPLAAAFGLPVAVDERLTEAANVFQGKRVNGPDGVLKQPASWQYYRNPFRPSWGEPYRQVALRMHAALLAARDQAAGHEAVCVSHQLPIVCLRRYLEGRHLWHDPRHRQCSLASLTSFTFEGDRLVGIGYSEPAGRSSNAIGRQTGA